MVERYNGFMNQQIRRSLAHGAHPESAWSDHVQVAAWSWNSQIKAIRGRSPFEILFGQFPRFPLANKLDPVPYAADLPVEIDEHRVSLLRNLRSDVHKRMLKDHDFSERFDPRPEPRQYRIGDQVLVYRSNLDKQWSGKFKSRWDGPFRISKIRPGGAYVLVHVPTRSPHMSRLDLHASPVYGGRPVNHLRLKPYRMRSAAGAILHRSDLGVLIHPE